MKDKILKEFDELLIKEYGKWKIGRAEAKDFIFKALDEQRKEITKKLKADIFNECICKECENFRNRISDEMKKL